MSPVDYHAWTHRPKSQGGTDPIEVTTDVPWARIARQFADANQTIATGSLTEVDCTASWNTGVGESGAEWFTVDLVTNEIELVQAAAVIIHVHVYWNSAITNSWFPFVANTHSPNLTYGIHAGMTATDCVGNLEFHTRVPAGIAFSFGVFHTDGANRALDAAHMDIEVIGTYSGTEFDVMDPDFA